MPARQYSKVRILVVIGLLVMILMRLVWLQRRDFLPVISPKALISFEVFKENCSWETLQDPLSWLGSTGYALVTCLGNSSLEGIVGHNRYYLAISIFLIGLSIRFLTSSWTAGLIAITVLLSRGRMVGEIALVSDAHFCILLLSLWLAAICHYVRTGALFMVIGSFLVMLVACLFERSLVIGNFMVGSLLLVGYGARRLFLPTMMRNLRRSRSLIRQMGGGQRERGEGAGSFVAKFFGAAKLTLGIESQGLEPSEPGPQEEGGALFRTLETPFPIWIFTRQRFLRPMIGAFVATLIAVCILLLQFKLSLYDLFVDSGSVVWREQAEWLMIWLRHYGLPYDPHLLGSLIILCLCMLQRPGAGLHGFHEVTSLLLVLALGVSATALLMDYLDFLVLPMVSADIVLPTVTFREASRWFEPLFLAFGVAGIYNLVKILDTWRQRRRMNV